MEWPPATGMLASAQIDAPPARICCAGLDRQFVHRHAHDREGEDRRAAHRVDIRQRVGGGDAAERERVVDDRQEEIGGRDHRLAVVDPPYRGVVGRLGADQQIGVRRRRRHLGEDVASTDGASLQPQPPPCARSVNRMVFMRRRL